MKSLCAKNSSSLSNEVNNITLLNRRLQNIEQEYANIDDAFKLNLDAIEIIKQEFLEVKSANEAVYKILSEFNLENIFLKNSPNQNPVHLKKRIAESTAVSFKDEDTQKLIELTKRVKDVFSDLINQIECLKQENFKFKKSFDDDDKKKIQSDSKLKSLIERLSQTEKNLKNEESEKKIALATAEFAKIELNKVQEELMLKKSELIEQSKKANDYKDIIIDLEKKKSKAEEEKNYMAKKIDELESKHEKSLNNEKEYLAHIKQIEATIAKNDNLDNIIQELQAKNKRLENECQDYEKKIKLRDQNLQKNEKEIEEMKKSCFDVVFTLDEENKKYRKEISQYESRYQGDFSNSGEKKIKEELLAALSKEIEDYKGKIKAIQINNVAMVTKVREITVIFI